ncbi:peptidase T [Streptococcus parauberis]|uniref:Peptidase T n=2 Tax=Streptococcus parauberis TaxID=1348 RepID=A0AAE4HXZ3_9STRE|nr:peptidase T [Streptococcus parauberis]AUT05760.1 Tripeptide aminopeptidase [Streptococcus parauberis]EMG26155.1 Tripeptide aminopeptidase [Streptococcus parauberis KRS-02083]KYP16757.1 Peptidase T [Streptococcus parauberis]KYP18444.1 Peptidase T [Streptococcus parauberis]KYP20653.1 Peptidase T [Streptococcus parauberis]
MQYQTLLDRFIKYVKENTRSNPDSTTTPSTESQVAFALNILQPEMEAIGLSNVHYIKENGYLIGTLPANSATLTRKIGFIAHMDTADFNAENVSPQIIENYQGGKIELGQSGYSLVPEEFPNLNKYLGQTLITTDGTTLLGSDDKSGIAEIMTAIEYLVANPKIEHCEIRVAFGPDEEIGVGANKFDVEDFDVDFAYTVDGGPLGELQYETFSAAALELKFMGRNVHPGTAKGQMVNAMQLAIDFHNQLPEADRPEKTDGYQGFYHLHGMSGSVEEAESSYIIRDFEDQAFEARKAEVQAIADRMNQELGAERVLVTLSDQYYNMKKVIEKDMTPITIAKSVMENLSIKPIIEPIRGGTDGSKISFMGIPTPNIFAGGENMHGRFEFVSLQTMEQAVDVIIGIVQEA